jgi:hypothetical protein
MQTLEGKGFKVNMNLNLIFMKFFIEISMMQLV